MNHFTTPTTNSATARLRPVYALRKKVGNFKLRSVVSKLVKSLTVSGIKKTSDKRRMVQLARRTLKALKKSIRKLTIRKQITIAAYARRRKNCGGLFLKKSKIPAVQLNSYSRLNSDGDRIPDLQTLEQVNAFAQSSNDLEFVLSKVRYHKENEIALNKRSRVILQLKKNPDSPELQKSKNDLDKILGNCHRELNEALFSGFVNQARTLLKHHGQDNAATRDLAKLLGGEDQPANFSLFELTRALTRFQQQAMAARGMKKPLCAAAA